MITAGTAPLGCVSGSWSRPQRTGSTSTVSASTPAAPLGKSTTPSLRPPSRSPSSSLFPAPLSPKIPQREAFSDSDPFITNGFLSLQSWLDNLILQAETGNPAAEIVPALASLKTPAYKRDNIALYLQGQTNNFLVLPLILPFLRLIYRLLYEKERKIREGMKMMGMGNAAFYASWGVTYLLIYTAICLVNASILKATVFLYSSWFLIFLFLWLFCLVLIFQSLFVRSLPFISRLLNLKLLKQRLLHQEQVRDHLRSGLLLPALHDQHDPQLRGGSHLRDEATGLAL